MGPAAQEAQTCAARPGLSDVAKGEEMPERERRSAERTQRGQSLVGYALLILVVAIAVFGILAFLGPAIGS